MTTIERMAQHRSSSVRRGRLHRVLWFVAVSTALETSPPAVAAAQGNGAVRNAPPNVLVILADDLGYSDVGCYGGEIATPQLDALAAQGLRFTQFYNTARCWPSRGALLSGYYAQQIGRDALPGRAGGMQGKRPRWAGLLPELLRSAGYRNYHSGKWHVDGPVLAAGFDRSLDMRNQGNYFSPAGNRIDDQPIAANASSDNYYATTATVEHAVRCLQEHAAEYPGRPFFQYVALIAPHFPLHAPPEDIARYADAYLGGWDVVRANRHRRQLESGLLQTTLSPLEPELGPPYDFPDALKLLGPGELNRPLPWEQLTPEQQRFQATKMAIHAAMVARLDQDLGRLFDQVRAMGAWENTLILFASDNGASAEIMVRDGGHDPQAAAGSAGSYLCLGPGFSSAANTPFRRHKTWVHEGGISTPLIAHWPQGIAARGELRRTAGHLIDLVPTILDLAGVAAPTTWNALPRPPLPGRSLVPALVADVEIDRDSLWWLHEGHRAVRVGSWKLVAAAGEPWALYDLRTDRAEQHDLSAAHPELVEQLAARWQEQVDEFTALAAEAARDQPDRR